MTKELTADEAGIVSWVHIGDLHLTHENDESDRRLIALVHDLERRFTGSVSFAFLPGDIANEGTSAQYAVVRDRLAALAIPWVAIIGDHDVHQNTLAFVRRAMTPRPWYSFDVGPLRCFALNAFDVGDGDRPRHFEIGNEQLEWLERALSDAGRDERERVVFCHCYPSDFRRGGEQLSALIHAHHVRVFEMGHTHYNELANDGRVLYVATRSTGQIEEGALGFSVTSIDGNDVSWRFITQGEPLSVVITSPTDERLQRDDTPALTGTSLRVRAKVWSRCPIAEVSVVATTSGGTSALVRIGDSHVWEGMVPVGARVSVAASDRAGSSAYDTIHVDVGQTPRPTRLVRDQDNAIPAWKEHDLLGTQLGPNKNGHDW